MTWVGPHYQAPLTLSALFSPLHAGDRAQVPFPPQEARHPPYLNKLLRGGEAAHAERHKDPAPSIAALGGVVGELLADLAVDLIPRQAGRHGREAASEDKPSSPQQVGCTCCPLLLGQDRPRGGGVGQSREGWARVCCGDWLIRHEAPAYT